MAHGSRRRQYILVFFALIVLTLLELGVVRIPMGKGLTVSALVGLALAKAAAVAMYFMHLRDETRVMRWMVGGCLLSIPPLYAFVLIAEAMFRAGLGQ
jgi:caa(3)-type oxidase subunit IV